MRATTCTTCTEHAESTFRIEGLCCHKEAATLEQRLGQLNGVERLALDVVSQRMRIAYDAAVTTTAVISEAVAETGMRAWVDQDRATPPPAAGAIPQTVLLGVAASALGVGLLLHAAGAPTPWTIALMVVAVVSGGVTTVRRAIASVRQRTLDMYVLMLVAVIGAAAIGEWFEAATVIVLFALAQVLERRSLDRARQAIGALLKVDAVDVRVRRPEGEWRVPLDQVRVRDVILLSPGERIPLDGEVVSGFSEVNQAPVTGESVPVTKEPGERVFAGTINGHGALDVRVTAVGDDTTLARIIHLVERAQEQRAPSQAWVDRFAQRYTPIVLLIAALVATLPTLVFAQPFAPWFYRALVLLVIACPCALVISTPVSIVSALAAAARPGVLIKGGVFLEKLATVKAVALDKTGTLTRGSLSVHEVFAIDGLGDGGGGHDHAHGDAAQAHVIATAAALGAQSEHPLARAVAGYAIAHGVTVESAAAVRALPGQGAEGRIAEDEVLIGSARLFEQRGIALDGAASELTASLSTVAQGRGDGAMPHAVLPAPLPAAAGLQDVGVNGVEGVALNGAALNGAALNGAALNGAALNGHAVATPLSARMADMASRGLTLVLVARGGRALGVIGLRDQVRAHGREAIDLLRGAGVTHVALLTGDHEQSARAAADAGHVDAVESAQLPADKVAAIHRIRARYGAVAMVGDGINDAPALAAADVGVAMGVAGTDAAIETADVALMADDLRSLPYALRLGRATLRTIHVNVAIALGLKLAFMTLAIFGLATLWMAVVADLGASFLVVGNGLRLLRVR